ncbi:hypothetical protein [Sphingomonas oleivorans]|uniref:hypothetical protein n=1 Tax=Sphingomonas oleivorans TaxID=1735121 RepID=UPI0010574B6B|nr:hypothetical protein [Sphingomonas oleivorans]
MMQARGAGRAHDQAVDVSGLESNPETLSTENCGSKLRISAVRIRAMAPPPPSSRLRVDGMTGRTQGKGRILEARLRKRQAAALLR